MRHLDGDHLVTVKADHLPKLPSVDEVRRDDAESRTEHAVERRRGPAALRVAEDSDPRFEPGLPL